MSRVLTFALLAIAAVSAHSQTFTNVSFNTTVGGASAAFVASGNSYTANITGFNLGPSQVGDIAWIFNFVSSPVPAYDAVTIEIRGTVMNGTLDIVGNEQVFDMSALPVQVANGTISGSFPGGGTPTAFTLTQSFSFSQPVTIGQAQKDILYLTSANASASITSIKQTFNPVPEPASLAVLGLGLAAVLRRRRR